MAGKKGKKGSKGGAGKSGGKGKAASGAVKKSSLPSRWIIVSALPGILLAIAAALWPRGSKPSSARGLVAPRRGSWTDGFYTAVDAPGQSVPSTHALLFPNGGGGDPAPVSFSSEGEFLALGRLYNDRGQIVRSPRHFENGTALYRGPEAPGTHFQWPAGE